MNPWVLLSPELVVAAGGLGLLVVPIRGAARLLGMIALSILVASLDLKLWQLSQQTDPQILFSGMLVIDRFAGYFQLAILAAMILVVLTTLGFAKEELRGRREIYALLLLTTVGLLILPGAQHLALVYIALELVSLLSYLMTGFLKKESLAVEAALKYFLFGSTATGALLYGFSLLWGLTGTMDLTQLGSQFPQVVSQAPLLTGMALLLILVGFGFKVALVPFHMWAPDAYEGAATPVTAFLSVGPKLAGFAILIRVLLVAFPHQVSPWPILLGLLSVLTMTLGNVVALVQNNVKRLLAYSSIAHAGFMVIGLVAATPLGITATLYYLLAYLLMNIGAFAGAIAVSNATGREDIGGFAGLAQRTPLLSLMITISFLSLAGIPPMAGFFAKLWIFGAALDAKAYNLAIVAAVNSVIALFYYLKVIKAMYLDPIPTGAWVQTPSRWVTLTLGISTVGLLLIGILPTWWWNFASGASSFSFIGLESAGLGADFTNFTLHL